MTKYSKCPDSYESNIPFFTFMNQLCTGMSWTGYHYTTFKNPVIIAKDLYLLFYTKNSRAAGEVDGQMYRSSKASFTYSFMTYVSCTDRG